MTEFTQEYIDEHIAPKLVVGAQIKIGENYAKSHSMKAGEVITLIEGWFDHWNGLHSEDVSAPSIKSADPCDDFDSIYHLFGNDLENFGDCEVLNA